MNRPLVNVHLRFSLFVCVMLIVGAAEYTYAHSAANDLREIQNLNPISYEENIQNGSVSSAPDQDLTAALPFAEAYWRKRLLPSYHEPILTRGASGIAVFRNASPSVVLVVVGSVKNEKFEPAGLGAGVIINTSGDILTNWHVIEGYRGAVIFFKPTGAVDTENNDPFVGQVIAQNELADLALVRLVKGPANVKPISLGNISSIQVAEDIHVIGHPEGNLWSYSTGVVSQIRNGYAWSYTDGSKHEANVLQLQTAINPGNSGGPVLDDQGNLLGLIAMSQEGQNLDYAVAVDVIQTFISH